MYRIWPLRSCVVINVIDSASPVASLVFVKVVVNPVRPATVVRYQPASLTQICIALRQTIEELLRGLLQTTALGLCQAKIDAVRVNHLILILAIGAFRRKPNRIAPAQLPPIAGHAHAHDSAKRGIGLIARRGILNATARRIVGIVSADSRRLDSGCRCAQSPASTAPGPCRAGAPEFAKSRASRAPGSLNPQVLRFLVDSRIAICRTRVVAQEAAAAAAALLFNRLEHVGQIARVVAGARHDLRAQDVGFSFIFAAELQEIDTNSLTGNLRGRSRWATDNLAANAENPGEQTILLRLGRLGSAVTQNDVGSIRGP